MKKRIRILVITILMSLVIIASLIYCNTINQQIIVTQYKCQTELDGSIKIIHLTDLHNNEYGNNNEELIDLVIEQSPDIIFMTGDMLNKDDDNLDIVKKLISKLIDIAPVYYSYGNHETEWMETYDIDLYHELTSSGAIVLDNEYVDITINGNELRIGGYMGYYRQPGMLTNDKKQIQKELEFFDDFEDTDRFKILLNHIPTQWVDWGYVDKINIELIFSGHYHGGIIQFPIIDRGLYAPYVGLFPKNTKGVFEGEKATCILSAGLGNEKYIPRINNPPEVVIIDIKNKISKFNDNG